MEILRDVYIGAVTAIAYSIDGKYVVYGTGFSICICDSTTCLQIKTIQVLNNSTIHGIRFNNNLICIFGQKEFSVFNWTNMINSHFSSISALYHVKNFVDWIWDVCFLDTSSDCIDQIAVGTAHNTVVFWNTQTSKPDRSVYGRDRCILYSMSILNLNGELLIASGTVFTEVHIWSTDYPDLIHVCRSHEGVIFKLRWSTDGRYLLSVSDDRALIIWKHTMSSLPWSVTTPTSCHELLRGSYDTICRAFGHTARLWDCIFTPTCIITSSEDCTVRFWNSSGTCIASMGGHRGKHIWCVAYNPLTGIAVTGGNDGAVKLWDVTSIVESYHLMSTQSFTIPTLANGSESMMRSSKSECIRDISVSSDGSVVFVASNWGYVWTLDVHSKIWHELYVPLNHESVSTMALSPDNEVVASGDCNGVVRIMSVNSRFTPQTTSYSDIRIARIFFSDGGLVGSISLWMFVVSADGNIHMYSIKRDSGDIRLMAQFRCESKAVITSLLWITEHATVCIGDSIGSVHLLQLQPVTDSLTPLSVVLSQVLKKTHSHTPVACLVYHGSDLWTTGHDGKIVPIYVNWIDLHCQVGTVIAVPQIKQILSVWWSDQNEMCVAGFHESNYIVFDVTNTYEVLTVNCGGWKRPWSSYHHSTHPFRGYIFAYASPNGHSDMCVFEKQMKEKDISPVLRAPSHGREINAVHWIDMTESRGILATGGEDRKVQIVSVSRGNGDINWSVVHSFDVHSSSVRTLSSCRRVSDDGFLLFSCGGRNAICIWQLTHDGSSCELLLSLPIRDCTNSVEGGDQRIMASTVLSLRDTAIHILCTGDSRGRVVLYGMRENTSILLPLCVSDCHTTPVLSLDITCINNMVYVAAGTAAGDLVLFDVTTYIRRFERNVSDVTLMQYNAILHQQRQYDTPNCDTSHVFVEKAIHVMGVNDIRVTSSATGLNCITVGDDQSIQFTQFAISDTTVSCSMRKAFTGVSGTSLRSLCWIPSGVYTTGWEQKVVRWNCENSELIRKGEMAVQVPETSCMDMVQIDNTVLGAVCGAMGFEIFEISV